jgi:hypothetical protein
MDGSGEKRGAVLIVFLEFQIRLNEALEDLVPIGAQ